MEARHTTTPYEVQCIQIGGIEIDQLCILSTAECREVATIDFLYSDGVPDHDKEKATAEFIVRACNAHDDLVAALQEVSARLNTHDPLKTIVLDALAKATGAA